MSSSPQFTSSPRQSMSADTNTVTPRRSNLSNVDTPGDELANDGSPTSTIFSGDSTSSAHKLNDSSRSTFQRMMSTPLNLGTPTRKVIIRSDPTLVTCFDSADKELCDLWVPKQ